MVSRERYTIKAHDRSKEFHWKFNRPVAAKMIQLQNPLLRFFKTTKGNFSGEDLSQRRPCLRCGNDQWDLSEVGQALYLEICNGLITLDCYPGYPALGLPLPELLPL